MVFPIAALFAAVKVVCVVCGAAFCTHKISEAYKKGQKVKLKNIERKSQADELKYQAALENNQKITTEENEWRKKYEDKEDKEKQLEREIEELKGRNKGNISEEERKNNNLKIIALQEELDGIRSDKQSILEKLKELNKQKDKNNQIISSIGSGDNYSEHAWIWDVLTLENILICLAIYAVWKIVKDEK